MSLNVQPETNLTFPKKVGRIVFSFWLEYFEKIKRPNVVQAVAQVFHVTYSFKTLGIQPYFSLSTTGNKVIVLKLLF